jgi:uncharacterized protein (DUF1810 family)
MGGDPFDLARFVAAQDPVLDQVRRELHAGRKTSHWMWFVFPQLKSLGRSSMAQYYGIASADEARAYLDHPLLGDRLRDCTHLVLLHPGLTVRQIFGSPDDLKFHSSMTLFDFASPRDEPFFTALHTYFHGKRDEASLRSLDG